MSYHPPIKSCTLCNQRWDFKSLNPSSPHRGHLYSKLFWKTDLWSSFLFICKHLVCYRKECPPLSVSLITDNLCLKRDGWEAGIDYQYRGLSPFSHLFNKSRRDQRKLRFCNKLKLSSLQPDDENVWYFNPKLFDLTESKV